MTRMQETGLLICALLHLHKITGGKIETLTTTFLSGQIDSHDNPINIVGKNALPHCFVTSS